MLVSYVYGCYDTNHIYAGYDFWRRGRLLNAGGMIYGCANSVF